MPLSEHGDYENPRKSPYTVERYESGWEMLYMRKLEIDKTVKKWTKNHGIVIEYITEAGNKRGYKPDFLVEKIDGQKEIHEVKGGQFLRNPDTIRKHERAKLWCKQRGMNFIIISKN